MALSSPRKVVPLNDSDSDRPLPRPGTPSGQVTKRAFFCAVVVETDLDGKDITQDVRTIVASLGEPISGEPEKGIERSVSEPTIGTTSSSIEEPPPGPLVRKRAMTNTSELAEVINEFVTTERSYVKRLQILKESYADPLRKYAKHKDTAIISAWEAATLFGNIDQLVPVNQAFLTDLEKMLGPNGHKTVGGIGDVALKHFKDKGKEGFNRYRHYYTKREEAQEIFQREMMKKSSTGFASYIERIKETTMDNKNRVGLRELLMDPVQRIPRYTMMFRLMLKSMNRSDPQYAKLEEAEALARSIAQCEADPSSKRVAALLSLTLTIEGCPADIVTNTRHLVDIIDVSDVGQVSTSNEPISPLPCTLVLFDDLLMLLRRPSPHSSGRVLAGLEQVEKINQGGIAQSSALKKSGLACKGTFNIAQVVFTDVGGSSLDMYLEVPPNDSDSRWHARPFRALSVVSSSSSADPPSAKRRFLENVWTTQALYRTREGRSVALRSREIEVESRNGRTTLARTFFNVYQRKSYLTEPNKCKVVLHIDPSGTADPIPFGPRGGPLVILRLEPRRDRPARLVTTTRDPNDEPEEESVDAATLVRKTTTTIHNFGLFKFQTDTQSRPGTPTTSTRSRATRFGLDFSRNLFGTSTSRGGGASNGDVFSTGTANSHRRSRSVTSSSRTRSDSLLKSSDKSDSTGITTPDEEGAYKSVKSRASPSPHRKLVKRGKSPGRGAQSEGESESLRRRPDSWARDISMEPPQSLRKDEMDESEWDLFQRLELARKNSQNQHNSMPVARGREPDVAETIYEEEPPVPLMQARQARSVSRSPAHTPTTPTRTVPTSPTRTTPRGPRSPSTKSMRSPRSPTSDESFGLDVEHELERTLTQINPDSLPSPPPPSTPSRKRMLSDPEDSSNELMRRPFTNAANIQLDFASTPVKSPYIVEPLSIKKKQVSSIRSSPTSARRVQSMVAQHGVVRGPSAGPSRKGSTDRGRSPRTVVTTGSKPTDKDLLDRILVVAETTKEDIQSSRRAIKRIKLELEGRETSKPPTTSSVFPRSPQTRNISAQASTRVAELRQRIEQRNGQSGRASPVREPPPGVADGISASLDTLTVDADSKLKKAVSGHEALQDDLRQLISMFKERLQDVEKTQADLQSTRAQVDLIKNLLKDVWDEKDLMYDAFNKELDCMYNDALLPQTEAWKALTRDLQSAKDARNKLENENAKLKRELAEARLLRDQSLQLLRQHNLTL